MKIKTKTIAVSGSGIAFVAVCSGTVERPRLTDLPQRRAHVRAGRRRCERHDDRLGVHGRAVSERPRCRRKRPAATSRAPRAIGKTIAERLIGKGVKRVVFDRNGFPLSRARESSS
jgi:NAD(P)-dependent dehydrogenase (short-subunit alcohol dehydrogenase family)